MEAVTLRERHRWATHQHQLVNHIPGDVNVSQAEIDLIKYRKLLDSSKLANQLNNQLYFRSLSPGSNFSGPVLKSKPWSRDGPSGGGSTGTI